MEYLFSAELQKLFNEDPFRLTIEQKQAIQALGIKEKSDFQYIERDDLIKSGEFKAAFAGKLLSVFKEDQIDEPPIVKVRTEASIGDFSIKELLTRYDPSDIDNAQIQQELSRRLNDKSVIAFDPETNKVAVPETLSYLKELHEGYPALDTLLIKDRHVRLKRVGELPEPVTGEEDPMLPGSPLRQNRSVKFPECDYSNISHAIKQFIRIIVEQKFINPSSIADRQLVMEKAREGLEDLSQVFPESHLRFKELEQNNDLPSLKLADKNNRVGDLLSFRTSSITDLSDWLNRFPWDNYNREVVLLENEVRDVVIAQKVVLNTNAEINRILICQQAIIGEGAEILGTCICRKAIFEAESEVNYVICEDLALGNNAEIKTAVVSGSLVMGHRSEISELEIKENAGFSTDRNCLIGNKKDIPARLLELNIKERTQLLLDNLLG